MHTKLLFSVHNYVNFEPFSVTLNEDFVKVCNGSGYEYDGLCSSPRFSMIHQSFGTSSNSEAEVEVPLTHLIVGEVSPNPKTGAYLK